MKRYTLTIGYHRVTLLSPSLLEEKRVNESVKSPEREEKPSFSEQGK